MSDNRSYICWHMQDPFPDWNVKLQRAYSAGKPYRMIKSFHPEDYNIAQAASPGCYFVYRNYADEAHQGAWIDRAIISPEEADAAADEFILRFKDSVNQNIGTDDNGLKYVESLNEDWPTHDPAKLAKMIAFEFGFIRRLPVHCPGCRPVVFCAAIGNPDHDEVGPLIPLAREVEQVGGAMGYHPYTSVYHGQDWIDSQQHQYDLHMRWAQSFDVAFVAEGIHVKWALGEGGPILSNADGYGPVPIPGWRHDEVYNGRVNDYIDHLRRLDLVIHDSLAAREGRVMGLALFTKPGRGNWATFDLPDEDITQYVIAAELPDHPPIEPPEEPIMIIRHETRRDAIISHLANVENKQLQIHERIWNNGQEVLRTHTIDLGDDLSNVYFRLTGTEVIEVDDDEIIPDVDRPIGCDVSRWQGNINFNTMYNAGAYWVYMKVSEGDAWHDPNFATYWPNARQTPLKLSGYHFWRASADAITQADNFVDRFNQVTGGTLGDFPLVLDVEDTNVATLAPSADVDNLRACLAHIESRTGVKPWIYTGSWYWNPRFGHLDFSEYAYIEAEYTHNPNTPPAQLPTGLGVFKAHQYTSSGDGSQYGAASDNIDLNVFNGRLSELTV